MCICEYPVLKRNHIGGFGFAFIKARLSAVVSSSPGSQGGETPSDIGGGQSYT